jgi:hypothetical protein
MENYEELVKDYLKKGGKVQDIPTGEKSETINYKYKRRNYQKKPNNKKE